MNGLIIKFKGISCFEKCIDLGFQPTKILYRLFLIQNSEDALSYFSKCYTNIKDL